MNDKKTVSSFAAAAAVLFISACGGSASPADAPPTGETPGADESGTSAGTGEMVKCLGVHECKGQSACGVEGGHACAGQNDCKGKGWIKVSQEECDSKGGTVL